jgi:hypothetical protein
MEIYKPTPAELKGFQEATIPKMRADISETLGQEGVDLLNDYIAAVKASQQRLNVSQ